MIEAITVIGTLRPERPRFGDHVSYDGVYVGLIVDIIPASDNAVVAAKRPDGKVGEVYFRLSSLRTASPRQ